MTISAGPAPLTFTLTRPASRPLAPRTLIVFLATLMVIDWMAALAVSPASAVFAVAVVCTNSGAAPSVTAHATATADRSVLCNRMSISSVMEVNRLDSFPICAGRHRQHGVRNVLHSHSRGGANFHRAGDVQATKGRAVCPDDLEASAPPGSLADRRCLDCADHCPDDGPDDGT